MSSLRVEEFAHLRKNGRLRAPFSSVRFRKTALASNAVCSINHTPGSGMSPMYVSNTSTSPVVLPSQFDSIIPFEFLRIRQASTRIDIGATQLL